MSLTFSDFRLSDLFHVDSGEFHATRELDPGDVPLIGCGAVEDGLIGYFDIPVERRHRNTITVAYNGSWPLLAKFHQYEFGAKDDVAVLTPRTPMRDQTLLYVAAVLNTMTWRYSYYRKTFRARVRNTIIPVPTNADDIDEDGIALLATSADALATTRQAKPVACAPTAWKRFSVTDLFNVLRGDFHSLARLDPGPYMTVSRVITDNGVVGYYDRPDGSNVYPAGTLTVSTLGGQSFVHMYEFIATDNVMILFPLCPMPLTTKLFVALMLNQQAWRYSYGRQCYRSKFLTTDLWLPVAADGETLDESYMRRVVESGEYWPSVAERLPT